MRKKLLITLIPEPKVAALKCSSRPKPQGFSFTITDDKEEQQILQFKKPKQANIDWRMAEMVINKQ